MSTNPLLPSVSSGLALPARGRRRCAAGLALSLTLLLLPAAPAARAEMVNRVVLVVNDQIATLTDYQQRLGERLAVLNRSEVDPEERRRLIERMPREVFREMLDEMLVLSRADQLDIRVGEPEMLRLLEQVRAANDIPSVEELQRAVAQSGQSWEQFKSDLAKSARFRELVSREVHRRIDLEEDDLRRFYRDNPDLFQEPEELRLREIVVLDTSGLSLGEMESLARDLQRRLAAGEEPGSVVENATEPPRTSGVIELDWVPKRDLDPNLEAAVSQLAPGAWSQPVPARGGLHLIQLLERKAARVRPFDEVQDEIYAREQDRLLQREYPVYLRELEERSYVRAEPPPGAEGFARAEPAPTSDPLEVFRRRPGEAPSGDDAAPSETAPASESEKIPPPG